MSPACGRRSRRVLWGYLVDGLRLGVVRVEEANELRRAHFSGMRAHEGRPLGRRDGREGAGATSQIKYRPKSTRLVFSRVPFASAN